MLEMLAATLDFLARYIIWIYVTCFAVIFYNLRIYAVARRTWVNTIFSVEREVSAHREARAMTNIGLMLGLVVVTVAVQHYVLPAADVLAFEAPLPTPTFLLLPTATPTPLLEEAAEVVTSTATPIPTRTPWPTATPQLLPTATPTPAPPPCPDPNVCITWPTNNAKLSGAVTIRGTAQHPNFQFYKIEYGIGENPDAWHSINDIVRTPVNNGVLMEFDSRALPNGVYWLRLTVVDITGNYPPPYQVRVIIEN